MYLAEAWRLNSCTDLNYKTQRCSKLTRRLKLCGDGAQSVVPTTPLPESREFWRYPSSTWTIFSSVSATFTFQAAYIAGEIITGEHDARSKVPSTTRRTCFFSMSCNACHRSLWRVQCTSPPWPSWDFCFRTMSLKPRVLSPFVTTALGIFFGGGT